MVAFITKQIMNTQFTQKNMNFQKYVGNLVVQEELPR